MEGIKLYQVGCFSVAQTRTGGFEVWEMPSDTRWGDPVARRAQISYTGPTGLNKAIEKAQELHAEESK